MAPTLTTPPAVQARAASALLVLLVAAIVAVLAAGPPNSARWTLLGLMILAWAVFGIAVWALMRVPVGRAVPLILIGAVLLQVVAVAFPPRATDDYFRYAWDGRVQASGTDPYRYAPTDPALAGLRDPWLFPAECQDQVPVCTRMNHPTDPTIYPPVAEGAFLGLHVLTAPLGQDNGREKPLQVLGALLALATTLALLRVLRRRGDPRWAALWAWCPAVVLEAGNNAHIDVLAALIVVGVMGAGAGRRYARAGLLLGAAIATKVLPVIVLPALLARLPRPADGAPSWRSWLRRAVLVCGSALGLIALVYLPHVLAVGVKVVGFLPAYLGEEGYEDGGRFRLLELVMPSGLTPAVGVLILLAAGVVVLLRGDPDRPWRGATVLAALAFSVACVSYPWYPLLLVALVALDGRAEFLAVAAAAYPCYYTRALGLPLAATQQVSYGLAILLIIAVTLWRRSRPVLSRAAPADPP